ncbi:hypothetical protein LSAT2_015739 [Lamellibrachia satsuma]|nr:hypothetical protein LSAT2_015739 [Lamellibrachia satsuma]
MRKYPHGGPGGSWVKKNYLYFFFAWNAFGLVAYQWYKIKREKRDDKWADMTSTQKYLAMMSNPDDAIRVINIRGGDITTTDTTMAKVTAPAKKSAEPYTE